MKFEMKIAVLLSTYNGEKYLQQQIDSILGQKVDGELSLIIRDDGSTDSTRNIIRKYQDTIIVDNSVEQNLGPALSFITLLKNHPGYDFYSFSDQDDFWYSEKLQCELEALKNYRVPAICFCNSFITDSSLQKITGVTYKKNPPVDFMSVMCAGGIQGAAMVFNRQLADVIIQNRLPSEISMHDAYVSRLCVSIGGRIVYLDETLFKYRQHENNTLGIKNGFVNKIKSRLHDVFYGELKVSIASDANNILEIYHKYIVPEKLPRILAISKYKDSFINRMRLAKSSELHFLTFSVGCAERLSILFGNR